MKKRAVSVMLTAAMVSAMLAGCGSKNAETQSAADTTAESAVSGDETSADTQAADAETTDQINLRRTKAKGVESLKYFMEFAQNGKLRGDYRQNEAVKNQGIKAKICRALADAGYEYQLNVGHSKFKVDIAVINPDHPEEYLLGIMTDGDSYCQSSNTKDREVAQFEVLKGLGWKLYRIWTMDWWDDPQKEITKLLGVLEMRKKEEQ